jgi:hypothetical protein
LIFAQYLISQTKIVKFGVKSMTDPGDTLSTALNLGTLQSPITVTEFVGSTDKLDYYVFNLPVNSYINLKINGKDDGFSYRIFNDINGDGLENDGNIRSDYRYSQGILESNNIPLSAGTCYVAVERIGTTENTNYELTLSASASGTFDPVDNTLATAQNFGTLTGTRVATGFVGTTDKLDYYVFNLPVTSYVNLKINGKDDGFSYRIFNDINGDGLKNDGNIRSDYRYSQGILESNNIPLGAGTYYVEVERIGTTENTNYELTLTGPGGSVTPPPPNPNPSNDTLVNPVYRFYNPVSRGHFFTINEQEKNTVLNNPQWGYQFENVGFFASATPGDSLLPVYRFYNPVSQGHFFTINEQEKNTVLSNPQWGYSFEGIGFYAYGADASLGQDVYRFYNPVSLGHFFTINEQEKNSVLNNPQWGYSFEGIGFEAGT